jgi:ATP-dependent helicase/nuclease subunit A
VAGLRDSGTREGEARATAEGAVQIMSVHAAKGLEFPVVAIGDVTHSRHATTGLLVDPELGVLPPVRDEEKNPPAVYQMARTLGDDQEDAESDRLLYVAATRAREKLILSGCIRLKQDGTVSSQRGWLGTLDGPEGLGLAGTGLQYDAEGSTAHRLDLQVADTPVACTIYEPGVTWPDRTPEARASMEGTSLPPPLLEPVAHGQERVDDTVAEQERIPPQRVWRVVPAEKRPHPPSWVIGSVVHEALAAWRFPNGEYERWAGARVRGYGVTDRGQLADAIAASRRLLLRFQAHPLCQQMEQASRRLHEVPYSVTVDGQVESGIIDALYLQGGTWTIVEFKTDHVRDEARFRELLAEKDYEAQARRYVAAMERLLGRRPQCVLCMLNWAGRVRVKRVRERSLRR